MVMAQARRIPKDRDYRVAIVNEELSRWLDANIPTAGRFWTIDERSVDVMYACIYFSSAFCIGRAKAVERKQFN